MTVDANPVAPGQGQFGFAGSFSSVANGGSNQLIDVPSAFLQTLVEGSTVWVQSVRDSYVWFPTDTDTADQLLIVKPTVIGAGAGRFVRKLEPSPRWMTQATWFIDPVAGNDENLGATAGAGNALKTDAERQRRWGTRTTLAQAATVAYASNLPSSDVVNYDVILAPGGTLAIHGTVGTSKTGTLNVVTSMNRGTQTPWSMTSTPAFDGTEVGSLIEITSVGARQGHNFWAVKNNGGGSIRMSQPGLGDVSSFAPSFNVSTPVNGDAYAVRTLTSITVGLWRFQSSSVLSSDSAVVRVDGISASGSAYPMIRLQETWLAATRSILTGIPFIVDGAIATYLLGCAVAGSSAVMGDLIVQAGAFLSGAFVSVHSGGLGGRVDLDTILQNASLLLQPGAFMFVGTMALFDNGFSGALTINGGAIKTSTFSAGANLIWGTNNTGFGVIAQTGGRLFYGTKPTVNSGLGVGRESSVGGTDKQWGAVPYVETNNLAEIVVYA